MNEVDSVDPDPDITPLQPQKFERDIERAVVLDDVALTFLQNFDSSLIDISVEPTTVRSDHVVGALTNETTSHDLIVLGATCDPFPQVKLVGSVARTSDEGCEYRYSNA